MTIEQQLQNLDEKSVRAFVKYSESNGKWGVVCYRKRLQHEITEDNYWKMIRIGHVQSYDTRDEAVQKSMELAEAIVKEFNF